MPQTGIHGLVGLAAARLVAPHAPAEAALPLTLAVTLGAMLPDLDLYPASIAYLATGRMEVAAQIHRSLTHSLFLMAALGATGLALRRSRPTAAWVLLGLPIGMLTHALLDIFFWFTALDLFWPLSHLPAGTERWWWPRGIMPEHRAVLPALDIWNLDAGHAGPATHLPAVFGSPDFLTNALGSMETLAFALFYAVMDRIAGPDAVKRRTRGLRRWIVAGWAAFALLLVAAVPLAGKWHVILYESALLLAFLPYGLVLTWKHRGSLASWARGQDIFMNSRI
jgi:membrane-bound metal-dependent hydrolase YbcI (DUF457 family)